MRAYARKTIPQSACGRQLPLHKGALGKAASQPGFPLHKGAFFQPPLFDKGEVALYNKPPLCKGGK